LPTDTEITLTFDRVDADGAPTPAKVERITGIISGSNLITYTRAIDNTTDQAHSAGAVVEYIWNADDLADLVDGILVEHSQTGKHTIKTVTNYSPAAAATQNIDLSLGNEFRIQMPDGNVILTTSNGSDGQKFIVTIIQDAVGSRTVTWFATISWVDGSAPTLTTTASKKDTLGFIATSSDTFDGYVVGQNI